MTTPENFSSKSANPTTIDPPPVTAIQENNQTKTFVMESVTNVPSFTSTEEHEEGNKDYIVSSSISSKTESPFPTPLTMKSIETATLTNTQFESSVSSSLTTGSSISSTYQASDSPLIPISTTQKAESVSEDPPEDFIELKSTEIFLSTNNSSPSSISSFPTTSSSKSSTLATTETEESMASIGMIDVTNVIPQEAVGDYEMK